MMEVKNNRMHRFWLIAPYGNPQNKFYLGLSLFFSLVLRV